MKLSVIIPALNEEAYITQSISSALMGAPFEVLVVNGGGKDQTSALSNAFGIQVIESPRPGRAIQMNAGAKHAIGDVMLFLHADTILPPHYAALISQAVSSQKSWGFFRFGVDASSLKFRVLELAVGLRSRILGLSYGDQAMFVTRAFFERLGGFDEKAALEDLDFLLRGRRLSRPCLLQERIITSARRWQNEGFWRNTIQNQIRLIQFLLER